ncbi:hypothetical protein QBC33DRAFT_582165 [Phialemonium atrogriseum]|uniref:Uncharacterized protein n=1 Tax=Phialemonium atrogriseum TaxID=1093897 RepID=A0AAJ0BNV9_9PEZI|nr:uncharacterized protein QBC33DRAFT_582165 [Phialemonium atrogriseum]KAK1761753.1 hypothetical protein QBC33DRAFT_582165 [Phialemonium atrogriseum]
MAQKIQLPYTLQTDVGMVLDAGFPAIRYFPDISRSYSELPSSATVRLPHVMSPSERFQNSLEEYADLDFADQDWFSSAHTPITKTAIACIRQNNAPKRSHLNGTEGDIDRFLHNINACRNGTMDIYLLIKLIKSRTRLDLEQAAAAVVSAFVNAGRLDDAELLLRELTGVLARNRRQTHSQHAMEALAHCAEKVYAWCKKSCVDGETKLGPSRPQNHAELVGLLLRIRRVRPRNRCLYIPAWLFREAGIDPPGDHAAYLDGYQAKLAARGESRQGILGYQWPQVEPDDGSIVLSKRMFRRVQTRIYRLYRFWNPAERLRRGVCRLEESVLYAAEWVNRRLRETDDVAKVACWFFAYQRRLQLKVVSDDSCTRFLAKGEGGTLYQNNLGMKSTFEEVLARVAGLGESDGLGAGSNDTVELIDRTCFLMRDYVDVYGEGKKENLIFSKEQRGGKGRGPDQGIEKVPGPVYKFLAKDIMHWNNAWGDDAFAGGKVHGWEDWLRNKEVDTRQNDTLAT